MSHRGISRMPEAEIVEKFSNETYFVKLLKEYYEKEAIFAAANMFSEIFYIKIDSFDLHVGIWFSPKNDDASEHFVKTALLNFCNETINQQTYRDLNRQFGSLRDKIYQYAFEAINSPK